MHRGPSHDSGAPQHALPVADAPGHAPTSPFPARPSDLVAFGSPVDHIGIYACGNTMVVASHAGDVVRVQQITRTPTAIRRVE